MKKDDYIEILWARICDLRQLLNNYAEFQGLDAAGIPFKGSLSLTTECKYVRLRYSKTVYTVIGGTLSITE